jgi:hypothetical protein
MVVMNRYILRFLSVLAITSIFPGGAYAENEIKEVPTTWRLQNYVSGHVVALWYTSASECTNGGLQGPDLTQDDFNRLWALILTAKMSGKRVGVFYVPENGYCKITSFYMED